MPAQHLLIGHGREHLFAVRARGERIKTGRSVEKPAAAPQIRKMFGTGREPKLARDRVKERSRYRRAEQRYDRQVVTSRLGHEAEPTRDPLSWVELQTWPRTAAARPDRSVGPRELAGNDPVE